MPPVDNSFIPFTLRSRSSGTIYTTNHESFPTRTQVILEHIIGVSETHVPRHTPTHNFY